MRVFQEEAEHLARRIRPLRVGVGAGGAAPGPGMAGALDHPVLEHRPTGRVGVGRAPVAPSAGGLTLPRRRRRLQAAVAAPRAWAMTWSPLRGSTVRSWSPWNTIVGTIRPSPTAGDAPDRDGGVVAPPPCMAAKADGMSLGGTGGETGVHADRGVEVGIGRGHDRGRRPAGREPGDVDPPRVDRIVAP